MSKLQLALCLAVLATSIAILSSSAAALPLCTDDFSIGGSTQWNWSASCIDDTGSGPGGIVSEIYLSENEEQAGPVDLFFWPRTFWVTLPGFVGTIEPTPSRIEIVLEMPVHDLRLFSVPDSPRYEIIDASTFTFDFGGLVCPGDCSDDYFLIHATYTPEPSTALLLGFGLVGIAAGRRRTAARFH